MPRFDMIVRSRSCVVAIVIALALVASAFAQATSERENFVPVASGALGDVNAKDGDAAFNADYFASEDLRGAPMASRLDAVVGAAPAPVPAQSGRGYSARWTATLTPKRSGVFPFSLRSSSAAVVKLDGRAFLEHAAAPRDFNTRSIARVPLEAGKPYELLVEFFNPTGNERIALEWSEPSPYAASVSQTTKIEQLAGPARGTAIGAGATRENATYTLAVKTDGTFVLTEKASGATAVFAPEFAVVFQPPGQETKLDPKGGKYADDGPVGDTNYVVPSWDKETDFLVAAHPRTRLRAEKLEQDGGTLRWRFPSQPAYALTATIELPADGTEPVLRFTLEPKQPGQFSVGYVGAPARAFAAADWIWQPLIWQDRRFPNRSYLTKEFQCPIPWVMAGADRATVGVGADPREMPYRMPTISDSRFGVLVRNSAGEAQPMLFAPVLGGPESRRAPGQPYSFSLRLVVRRGPWFDTYKHLSRSLYAFRDYRENALCSLNTTIENLTDYVLNDALCYWYARYKTWGYQNDGGPGAGRQQSAADALSLALVLDRAEFLERRARPTLEYMLSRNTVSTKFSDPRFMGGFVNNATDLVAAYRLAGARTTVIRDLLAEKTAGAEGKKPAPGNRNDIYAARMELTAELANFRLTADRGSLARARDAADRYIALRVERPAADFRDLGSSFWTEMAPAFDLLYELHEETGERRYLDAAVAALRHFTAYTYLVPVIPDGNFVANPGNRYNGQPVPEEIVPAWRVSANGLAAECAGTAHSHRGVFMASYASWMARLARDGHEPFFRDIARSAVVGRYANYPSYAYRNGYTTLHQKPDYPLRPFEEIKKFTSAHYNHPLPMAAFLVDYLVSDIYARSDGRITFPSDYTNTGAFFRNKVYGVRPGRFYEDAGVHLWLPKGLLAVDSIQLNYVAAHGNGRLYLAFSNQSDRSVTTAFAVNSARADLRGSHRARVWHDNQPVADITVIDGRATISVSPKGLTAVAIDGAAVTTEIQHAAIDSSIGALPAGSSQTVSSPFGDVTATALRFGRGLTTVHVWAKAGPEQFKRARLDYTVGGETRHAELREFPFETTIAVPDTAPEFVAKLEAELPDGSASRAPPLRIVMKAP